MFEIQTVLHEVNICISEDRIAKKVPVNMELDLSCQAPIISYQSVIEIIYQNLILNAVECCKPKQVIFVFVRIENMNLQLDVADEGKGMTKEEV